jgi:hypothetical protein
MDLTLKVIFIISTICWSSCFGWPDFETDIYIYNRANIKASREEAILARPEFLKG